MANPNQEARNGKGRYVRTPSTAESDRLAAELRAKGWHYRAIAAHLNCSLSSAHDAVGRALKAIVEEPAHALRQLELERLDAMYVAATEVLERAHVTVSNGRVVCLDGDPLPDDAPVLAAIDRLVKISESRRKLLGMDAPAKVDLSGGVKYEIVGVDPDQLT